MPLHDDPIVRGRMAVRIAAICGPALTGTTISWSLHALVGGKLFFRHQIDLAALPWMWLGALTVGLLFTLRRDTWPLTASVLSIFLGASLGLGHHLAVTFLNDPKMSTGDYMTMFFHAWIYMLITVTLSGIFWMPIVCLSWRRHQLRALALQRSLTHA